MTKEVLEILKKLKSLNARLYLNDGVLKLDIQKEGLSEELKAEISENKQQLIEFLRHKESYDLIPIAPEQETYPLSAQQARLWLLCQLDDATNSSYNISGVREVPFQLDEQLLEKSVRILTERHESLRTTFVDIDGEPRQRIASIGELQVDLTVLDYSQMESAEELAKNRILEQCSTPFNLEQDALLKIGVIYLNEGSIFYYCMHHIISDAWSTDILLDELFHVYAALETDLEPKLPKLPLQYKDYAVFQLNELHSEKTQNDRNFWLEYLSGELTQINLPGALKRPDFQTHNGRSLVSFIPAPLANKLTEFSRSYHGSLFMTLTSVWSILMYRYTGQKDTVIGVPVAGREREELEGLIGFFVNTIPLRNQLDRSLSFNKWCESVRDNTLQAFAHQGYPFDQIVKDLEVHRDRSRNALFDVMMVFHNTGEKDLQESGTERAHQGIIDAGDAPAKLDLDITFREVGKEIYFGITFNTAIYLQQSIEGLMKHFVSLLEALVNDPDKALGKVEFLSPEEQEKLVVQNNLTAKQYPLEKTIAILFEEQAEKTPDAVALQDPSSQKTYKQLSQESSALAVFMSEILGINHGDVVGIKLERSADNVLVMLALFKIGACCCPLDPEEPAERLKKIESNCQQLFTASELEAFRSAKLPDVIDFSVLSNAAPEDLAYVIHTSGSTGVPKGVMLHHRGIVNHLFSKIDQFELKRQKTFLHASKLFFVGGIWQTWAPLLSGNTLIITPSDELMDISLLLDKAKEHEVEHLEIIPSQLNNLFALNQEQKLTNIRSLTLTGEKYNPNYVARAFEMNPEIRIQSTYGQTECSDVTIRTDVFKDTYQNGQNVGRPIENTRIFILNEDGMLCPEGVPGEICTAGVGVTKGYLNEEALTNDVFISHELVPGEKLYKTGDLGRWLADGTVELSGRKGNQIKLRGQRFELGEIEQVLLLHDAIENAVVLFNPEHKNTPLTAYLISEKTLAVSELRDFLSTYIPKGMIPSNFVTLESFPLMPNGKVNKKALKQIQAEEVISDAGFKAPTTETEKRLALLWSSLLDRENIGVHDDFYALGGHSLLATRLASLIHKEFEVKVALKDLFEHTTIEAQASAISGLSKSQYIEIKQIGNNPEGYNLSPAQRRFWILSQMTSGSRAYNMSGVLELQGNVNIDCLNHAFNQLIDRHEILRTEFRRNEQSELKQFVLDKQNLAFSVEFIDVSKEDNSEKRAEQEVMAVMASEFNLAQWPLLAAKVISKEEGSYVFVFSMHHILGDAWSISVMTNELIRSYSELEEGIDSSWSPLTVQYKDYAHWQNEQIADNASGNHKEYWLNNFSDTIPVLSLMGDKPRPSLKTFSGARITQVFDKTILNGLNSLGQNSKGTLFVTLLASVKALLHKYTAQEDLVIGSPIAGRVHADLEGQIGCYINTLALRTKFSAEDQFIELLENVKTKSFEAFEHQVYPFDELVEHLDIKRDLSRSALFDVMVVLQNAGEKVEPRQATTDLTVKPYEGEMLVESKFDITFTFHEGENELLLDTVYNTDIYEASTIQRMVAHLGVVFEQVLSNPDIQLRDIDLVTPEERKQLLVDFNDNYVAVPTDLTFIDMFEQTVAKYPDNTALVFGDRKLSYRELNAYSNQLGAFLRSEYQIQPNDIIGVCLEKSDWLIVAILGVIKSGAGYLPLNPVDPQERIDYALEDSCVRLMIDEQFLQKNNAVILNESPENLSKVNTPEDLIYVIYTSGSTGRPKGVAIEHRNLMNYQLWFNQVFEIGSGDHSLLLSNVTFDGVNSAVFGTLLSGAKLGIINEEMLRNPIGLVNYITQFETGFMKITPTHLHMLIQDDALLNALTSSETLRLLVVGGEQLNQADIHRIYENSNSIEVVNHYGPTEATIGCVANRLERSLKDVSIGKPIANAKVRIVQNNRLAPVGVPGEICVSGPGIAREYINKKELTAERFVSDSFEEGLKMYRTGDLGRWTSSGTIEFLGRMDHQVKIRGFRIELQEIEFHLMKTPEVNVAVVVYSEKGGVGELTAYLSTDKELTVSEIRNDLKLRIPEYMIPEHFVTVSEFPLTTGGKVDRQKLSGLKAEKLLINQEFVAPQTATEKLLAEIWSEVLEHRLIGTQDNFFDLGGNSLKIIRVNELVNQRMDRKDPVPVLFQYPSIKAYGEFIDQQEIKNQLTDEEIEESADDLENALLMFNNFEDEE